jgi:hypothetical protein
MDSTDYVNVYIDTLNKKLHEEINRNIMHEAKITLLEKVNADLNQKLQEMQLEIDKYKKKKNNADNITE